MKYVNDDLEISCNESERNFFWLIWWKKINSNEEDKKRVNLVLMPFLREQVLWL